MTTTPIGSRTAARWTYATPVSTVGRDPTRFPRAGVIGEIKPHNVKGIRAGIIQLRGHYNRNRGREFTYQLVTYRQVPGDVTRYEVLLADPVQLGRIVRSNAGQGRIVTWYGIGQVVMRDATTPVPLWQCGPLLGTRLEPKVRAMYQGWMRNAQGHAGLALRLRPATAGGPDFTHEANQEFSEFLRELATELEVGMEAEAW